MKRFLSVFVPVVVASLFLLLVSCSRSGIVDGAAVKLVQPGKTLSLSPDSSVEGRFAEVLNCFAVQVVSDSIIVFQAPASEESPYHFRAYSLNTLDCLGAFVRSGRGPGEMVSPHVSRSNTEERYLALNDNALGQAYLVDVEETLRTGNLALAETYDLPENSDLDWMPLPGSGQFVMLYEGDEVAFCLKDGSGSTVKTIYPYGSLRGERYVTYLSSILVSRVQTSDICEVMMFFPQINLIDGETGRIRSVAVDKSYRNWESVANSAVGMDTMNHYVGATSASGYIFAAYKGLSLGEMMQGGSPTSIHVFNWDGDFLYDIGLEEDIDNIAYDSRSGHLYGFDKASGRVVRYDFGGLL